MGKFTVVMEKQKETKNTIKFQEVMLAGDETEKIGQQYVQKGAFEGATPQRVTITVEW